MKNISSLFIGFRKLDEFSTIWDAKQFARRSKLTGVFNLIGENYRDSWYVFKSDIKNENNQGYNRENNSSNKSE